MSKIIDYKNMSMKQKIIFLLIVIIIVILLSWIVKIIRNNIMLKSSSVIKDYKEVDDGTYFTMQSTPTYDRKLYWNLNDIISGYIESSKYSNNDTDFSIDNYFDALTTQYAAYLGENKYRELSNNFLKKFELTGVQEKAYKTYDFIKSIYEFKENMYICELSGVNNQIAYMGIVLNEQNKTFEIFYIE